jgi:hypothetical protein
LTEFWNLNKIMTDVTGVKFVRACGLKHRQLMAFLDQGERQCGDTAYCFEFDCLKK